MDDTGPSDVGRRWHSSATEDPDPPAAGPDLERIESTFLVTDTETDGETLLYYGEPLVPPEAVMQEIWPAFRDAGYESRLTVRDDRYVVVAEPTSLGIDGVPWTNLLLLLATIVSTLFAGAEWYYLDPFANPTEIWRAWPFTAALLGILGVHELGHYAMSRYHRVDATLPYFIPVPTLIGTMGAVIKMKGRMPDRKALFDIGVAGPLAGLIATVVVTVIGLHLPPVHAPPELLGDPDAIEIQLGYPPLLELLAAGFDRPLYRDDPATVVNPVVIAGWVGMFVTFLNLIPVGHLDGGHILRAILGELQATLGALVPAAMFGLVAYLYADGYAWSSLLVWILWGGITALLAAVGPVRPMNETRLGIGRVLLGVVTFVLGALCFMPVPVEIVE